MTRARLRIAFAALALAATPALAQDKVRFQTDWIPSGEHAMYYGGWQKEKADINHHLLLVVWVFGESPAVTLGVHLQAIRFQRIGNHLVSI